MVLLDSIFGWSDFLPPGYCLYLDARLAVVHGRRRRGDRGGLPLDISVAILSFVRQRRDRSFIWLAILFSAFIFSCGVTHAIDIGTVWQPDDGLQALTKAITAGISIFTAATPAPPQRQTRGFRGARPKEYIG